MNTSYVCSLCERKNQLTPKERAEAERDLPKGKDIILATCPVCEAGTVVQLLPPEPKNAKKNEQQYRCPISGCTGYAVYVTNFDPQPFWGCGECGSVWRQKDELFNDIDRIVKRFAHRRACYKPGNSERWVPGPRKAEPRNYDEMVEGKEPLEAGHADSAKPRRRKAKAKPKAKPAAKARPRKRR
jgi:hypothetical protein